MIEEEWQFNPTISIHSWMQHAIRMILHQIQTEWKTKLLLQHLNSSKDTVLNVRTGWIVTPDRIASSTAVELFGARFFMASSVNTSLLLCASVAPDSMLIAPSRSMQKLLVLIVIARSAIRWGKCMICAPVLPFDVSRRRIRRPCAFDTRTSPSRLASTTVNQRVLSFNSIVRYEHSFRL